MSDQTCKSACDNDAYCKGYTVKDINGGVFCRIATASSQCPHNWESLSGGTAPLDPSSTCESSFNGCFVKQNGQSMNLLAQFTIIIIKLTVR